MLPKLLFTQGVQLRLLFCSSGQTMQNCDKASNLLVVKVVHCLPLVDLHFTSFHNESAGET